MKMKLMQTMMMVAIGAAAMVGGCKSIEVEKYPDKVAVDADGKVVTDADGNPVKLGGWSVDYFQHWNWQRFDELHAKAGEATLDINGYASGADSNLVKLVSVSLDGVARITEKVVSAIVTGGGSVAANGGSAAIAALANKFIASGGDAEKATVTCKDGACTVTDGTVSCTEAGCVDCAPAER